MSRMVSNPEFLPTEFEFKVMWDFCFISTRSTSFILAKRTCPSNQAKIRQGNILIIWTMTVAVMYKKSSGSILIHNGKIILIHRSKSCPYI
jgi:hypothetical protein